MTLTLEEQETGINFSNGSDIAIVYTANVPLKTKLDKLCKQYPKEFQHITLVGDNGGIKSYHISKKRIAINAPKIYSEKVKKSMKEQGEMLGKRMIAISKTHARINQN